MFSSLSLNVKIVLLLLVVTFASLASSTAAYKWQANKYENLLTQQARNNDLVIASVNNAAAEWTKENFLQRIAAEQQLADLDAIQTKERSNALKEHQRVSELATSRGVYIKAFCPSGSSASNAVSQTTGSPSLDDGTSVRLPEATRRNLLLIREGIIKDQAALRALQAKEAAQTKPACSAC